MFFPYRFPQLNKMYLIISFPSKIKFFRQTLERNTCKRCLKLHKAVSLMLCQ